MGVQQINPTLNGFPLIQPDPDLHPEAMGKANSWFSGIGPYAGHGWVLIQKRYLDQLYALIRSMGNTDENYPFDPINLHLTFEVTGDGLGAQSVTIKRVCIKGAKQMGVEPPNDDSVYLLELTDTLDLAKRSNSLCRNYNVRNSCPAEFTTDTDYYLLDSLTNSFPDSDVVTYSWLWFVRHIFNDADQFDVAGPYGIPTAFGFYSTTPGYSYNGNNELISLPYVPTGVPQNMMFWQQSRWDVFHSIMDRLGCAFVRNPLDFSYRIVRLGAEQTGLANLEAKYESIVIHDGERWENPAMLLPANLFVCFPYFNDQFGDVNEDEFKSFDNAVLRQLLPGALIASCGGIMDMALHDDLPAVAGVFNIGGAGVPRGQSVSYAGRVIERQANLELMMSVPPSEITYQGIVADILPGEQVRGVRWFNFGEGFFTTVYKHPGLPRNIIHDETGIPDLGQEWQAPSSFTREPIHVSPRQWQVCKVTGATASGGYFPGVASIDPADISVPCWIKALNDPGQLVVDDRYLGMLQGSYDGGDGPKPVLVVQDYASLTCTGVLLEFDHDGQEIVVGFTGEGVSSETDTMTVQFTTVGQPTGDCP